MPLPEGVSEESASNLDFDLGDEERINDIRGANNKFTLDEHGFTTCAMDMSPHLFSEIEIINSYIPVVCEMVKEVAKADRVISFDWRVNFSSFVTEIF